MKYVDVVIDTKSDNIDTFFSYLCADDAVKPGCRVTVPFKGSKPRGGYVFYVYDQCPEKVRDMRLKEVLTLDYGHSVTADSVEAAVWMRRRYFCRYIEAINCFAPIGEPPKRRKKDLNADAKVVANSRGDGIAAAPEPTGEQAAALSEIMESAVSDKPGIFLVHGVTGSGKTELYMRVASGIIDRGRKVIVLVPEISLTPQLISRFTGRFGEERVAVLHSKRSKGERYEAWQRIRSGRADVAIGARSAVFAPFENIGAIIVDEEHETSYKSDMAPKYDTVEVAIRRARASGAVTLLGSATPSIVSMYRAETGVYRLITMTKRYNENPLPSIVLADMREELSRGNRSIFSTALHERMKTSLTRGRQIILFLNRRGYSPFVECLGCGYALSCSNCGLSMTYHKHEGTMVCHFCGMTLALPTACPQCGSPRLRQLGIGTEKVEELTAEAFAGANISRLDLDTASRKGSAAKILDDFAKKKADILIGTQMVAKGLDFANVDLVGVIAADISLNIPDFRSAERTFQLITQAAGRSGRGTEPGEVVVQTYLPDNYAIKSAASNDYKGFYRAELNFRRLMCYPPFSDIVQLTISAASEDDAKYGAEAVCRQIKEQAGKSIQESELLGPQRAAIYYFGELYRYRLYIKMRPEYRRAWEELLAGIKQKANTGKDVRWRLALDVNPYSLL